jgi:hypothetical protein
MADPAYTVSVLLNGTPGNPTFTTTHGDPNPEPLAPTILADPFTYKWSFEDEMIPNPLSPSVASVDLWSTSKAVAPLVTRGQIIRVTVRAGGPAADRILEVWVRVTEVTADLVPGSPYPYRQTIKGADLLADLGSWFPGPETNAIGGGIGGFRHRLAWVARWSGHSIGTPTWWPDVPNSPSRLRFAVEWLGDASSALFALILRSWAPSGLHHALTPYVGASYPAGYEFADSRPDVMPPGFDWTPYPDPNSGVRYMVQPAGRRLLTVPPLPLRFIAVDGVLNLTGPTGANRMPTVSADVCVLPTTMRQGREHAPNVVRATGVNTNLDGTPENLEYDATKEVSLPDATASGPRGRNIDTMLAFNVYSGDPEGPTTPIPAAATEVASYLADASQLAELWTFDGFTIQASAMTATDAASALPVITPAYMDAGRDGQLVRHITVHSIAPDVRPDATRSTISGFIVAGELSIRDGQMDFNLTTTPGAPVLGGSPSAPITVGEFTAAAYADLLVPNVNPNITLADLANVDA